MHKDNPKDNFRKFGVGLVGSIPWGTHLCQFYESKQDLIDILVPYFAEGLRSNDFCMWVTSQPLEVEEAKQALRKEVPDLNDYLKNGQIEIISYDNWYLIDGKFDSDRVLKGWVDKEKSALERGFEGLRLTGNTFWIERELWSSFVDYEEAVNSVIGKHRMLAVCTYCLTNCSGTDVLDVVRNHIGTLVKQGKKWYLVEDATRRQTVNGALKLSEQKYTALFKNMQDGFAYHKVLLDDAGKPVNYVFLEVNDAFERLTGLKSADILGKRVTQVLLGIEKDPANWIEVYGKVALAGEPVKFENYSQALGKWYSVSAYSPEKGYFVATFEDITERKKAEDALRESEKRLSRSQEIAHLGSWELDLIDNKLSWSDEVYRIFGLKPQEFGATYEDFLDAVHPDDRKAVNDAYSSSLHEGRDSYEIEHRVVRKLSGEVRFVYEKCQHIRNKSGKIIRSIGMVQDITARKEMEKELLDTLKASQRRQMEVSALLEASKAVLVHREFSNAAHSIFGSCKELLGATAGYVALLSKDGMENEVLFLDSGQLPCTVDRSLPMPIRGLRAQAYITGKVVFCNDFADSEWAGLMPNGHVLLRNVLFAPLTIGNKTVGLIGLANKPAEFTERDAQMASAFGELSSIALINSQMLAKLEENEKLLKAHSEHLEDLVQEKTRLLRDSERLAAIGQTAGMVGHDIRNPLQSITGDVYLAKMDLASCPDNENKASVQESLEAIEKNVEYINKIVIDLQDFAKILKPVLADVNLKPIVDELLCNKAIPQNIQVFGVVEKDAEKITADSAYMKRILNNLFSNAIQAMPQGGKLRIHIHRESEDTVITVEDTGMGIPEEVKPRLFQPLFTTKSKGQGFGLPVVKRMTEALNGTVSVESQFGKGTKFILRFPHASRKN